MQNPEPTKETPTAAATAEAYRVDHEIAARIDPARSLLVNGFWRSGTTWLQHALGILLDAKIVFEPLWPTVPEMQTVLQDLALQEKGFRYRQLFMPYSARNTFRESLLFPLFDKALRSDLPGEWIRVYRKGPEEHTRENVVVKCVRAHLCLRAAQETFGMPVLHIYRDPRAIVASLRMTEWFYLFEKIRLKRLFLEVGDGREEYFDTWRQAIKGYDKADPVTRIAAYWSLVERFVADAYSDSPPGAMFIQYETLCQEREQFLLKALEQIGLPAISDEAKTALAIDSASTSKGRHGASVKDRISGWKHVLSSQESDRVAAVARQFGFTDRLIAGDS